MPPSPLGRRGARSNIPSLPFRTTSNHIHRIYLLRILRVAAYRIALRDGDDGVPYSQGFEGFAGCLRLAPMFSLGSTSVSLSKYENAS